MPLNRVRIVYLTLREGLFVAIAAAGSWLFLNHEILYLRDGFSLASRPIEAYVVTAVIAYVFIRSIVGLASLRLRRPVAVVRVCPNCGRSVDSPASEADERPSVAVRIPTSKELLAARAFRWAVADARVAVDRPDTETRHPVEGISFGVDDRPINPLRTEIPGDRVVPDHVVRYARQYRRLRPETTDRNR